MPRRARQGKRKRAARANWQAWYRNEPGQVRSVKLGGNRLDGKEAVRAEMLERYDPGVAG